MLVVAAFVRYGRRVYLKTEAGDINEIACTRYWLLTGNFVQKGFVEVLLTWAAGGGATLSATG